MADPASMHTDDNTHSNYRVMSINTDVYINNFLACACCGMSIAIPDNACIMVSSHFTGGNSERHAIIMLAAIYYI